MRDAAVRVYELHELEAQRKRIEEQEEAERKRIDAEKAIVAEELKLRELRRTTVPKPPPEPPTPEPVASPVVKAPPPQPQPQPQSQPPAPAPQAAAPPVPAQAPPAPVTSPPTPAAARPPTTTAPLTNGVRPAAAATPAPTKTSGVSGSQEAINARYVEIHRELKQLRTIMKAEARKPGTLLKENVGQMRREIGKSVGQLTATGVRGENKQQVCSQPPSLSSSPHDR